MEVIARLYSLSPARKHTVFTRRPCLLRKWLTGEFCHIILTTTTPPLSSPECCCTRPEHWDNTAGLTFAFPSQRLPTAGVSAPACFSSSCRHETNLSTKINKLANFLSRLVNKWHTEMSELNCVFSKEVGNIFSTRQKFSATIHTANIWRPGLVPPLECRSLTVHTLWDCPLCPPNHGCDVMKINVNLLKRRPVLALWPSTSGLALWRCNVIGR